MCSIVKSDPCKTLTSSSVISAHRQIRLYIILLFIFIGALPVQGLFAQSNTDEFKLVKGYQLPDTAVNFSALSESSSNADSALKVLNYLGKPFSGISFERYKDKSLSRVQTYKDGLLNGPSYVWYPDGNPQMAVNYRRGRLSGRFLGWYIHGGILYDMVLNSRGYAGDYIEDGRASDSGQDDEVEGDATTNDKE